METSTANDFPDKMQQERNWKRLSEWIHCICVVTFDLELGQAMEVCNKMSSTVPCACISIPISISALSAGKLTKKMLR